MSGIRRGTVIVGRLSLRRAFRCAALALACVSIPGARADCRALLAHALDQPGYFLSQYDPELMAAYRGADYLCGETCVANAFRLAESVASTTKDFRPFGLAELREYIDSFEILGIKIKNGTSGQDLAVALEGVSSRAQALFDVDLVTSSTVDRATLGLTTGWLKVVEKPKLTAGLLGKDHYDFFVLGTAPLGHGRASDEGHFVMGVFDPEIGMVRILDPKRPGAPIYYRLERTGTSDGAIRLVRAFGGNAEELAVDEFLGFRLKRKPGAYHAGGHNPLLGANPGLAEAYAPFVNWSCARQGRRSICYRGAERLDEKTVYAAKKKAKSIHARLTPHESIPNAFFVDGRRDWVVEAADVDELVAAADAL